MGDRPKNLAVLAASLALFALALGAFMVLLALDEEVLPLEYALRGRGEEPPLSRVQETSDVDDKPESLPSPPSSRPAPPPSRPPERPITDVHRVRRGEFFSLITGIYWGDIYLWPDLYVKNDMSTNDPDLIYPGELIDIYSRLGRESEFLPSELEEIRQAYLKVYLLYKALGPRKRTSVLALLHSAVKYDRDFLERYADRIDPEDRARTKRYIAEFGYLE